jgi:tRNA(Ile)-lysidine synthase
MIKEKVMKEVLQFVQKNNLIKTGDKVGVAVSGGVDSMVLLHWLNQISKQQDFSLVAITIDHCIRENSYQDNKLVIDYCKENNIKVNCFKVDAVKFAKTNKQSIETAARNVRYGVFDSLLSKKILTKIALAHHQNDQAETVLMNLFRGAGNKGVGGMQSIRGGYIRPFLSLSKEKIVAYAKSNNLPFAVDQTNFEDDYARNFLRNQIMPLINQQWQGSTKNIASFAEIISSDNDYFNKIADIQGATFFENIAKVPTSWFLSHPAIYARQIFKVLSQIGCKQNIERKHIKMISEFALTGQSGKKINLPSGLCILKEYDFIIFQNKSQPVMQFNLPFKQGKFKVGEFGEFEVKKVNSLEERQDNQLFLDAKKVPKGSAWRLLQSKDMFEKFGGGTKSLKSFLVDKKIPARKRKILPVLAYENNVLAVLGVEISELVKVDENTKKIYKISVNKKV